MSHEDLTTIIEKVSVIFHVAAAVRFDEELRKYAFSSTVIWQVFFPISAFDLSDDGVMRL